MINYLLISQVLLSSCQSKLHGKFLSPWDRGLRVREQGDVNNSGTITTTVNHTLGSPHGGGNPFWRASIWCDGSERGVRAMRWGWKSRHEVGPCALIWQAKCKWKWCDFQANQLIAHVRFNHPIFSYCSNNIQKKMLNHHMEESQ